MKVEMSKEYVINPDRFKNFFNELDTHRTLLTTVTDLNTKLFNHFLCLQQTLDNKSQTLDTQILKFKETTQETLQSIENREHEIPEKEVKLAARVRHLKDSSITDITSGIGTSDLLRMWFRRMDSKGLIDCLSENRKDFVKLRVETATAAEEAVDLLGFVLEAIEDFVNLKISGKKIGGLGPTRYACGVLIQAAFPIPYEPGPEPLCLLPSGGGGVSTSLKKRAAALLEKWKGVLSTGGDGDGDGVRGEAIMFLTMVTGFGLKQNFDDEFFRSLVLEVGSKRDMAKLAVALLSGDYIRDIIEELVKTGKEVEAVYIASEAGLTHLFSPVKLLKTCLSNCQITTSNDAASREDLNNELKTTRVILKCIEDHKLESEFNMSSLKKRITQLEKLKADKKKTTTTTNSISKPPSNKRSHTRRPDSTTSRSRSRPPKISRVSKSITAFRRHPPPPAAARYPSSSSSSSYGYSRPSVYDNRLTTDPIYSGVRTQTQDVRAGGSYGGHVNYGAYEYNGLPMPSEPTTYAAATYNL